MPMTALAIKNHKTHIVKTCRMAGSILRSAGTIAKTCRMAGGILRRSIVVGAGIVKKLYDRTLHLVIHIFEVACSNSVLEGGAWKSDGEGEVWARKVLDGTMQAFSADIIGDVSENFDMMVVLLV
ncbi:hypothetical protein PTI98_011584 [Pleurotus ostreatus]|nr:hypothetical protein PTI98_011584 [Pleurotus ostreatus]